MFKKILIANRGEIACRIIRTVKKLNILAVAVYSEADQFAEHVKQADEAYSLGKAEASKSYLCIEKIISVAKEAQVDAIHPGYGFLAENAAFAKACRDANIVFIGPPIKAIHTMGNKAAAKALMIQHGVPVLPGDQGASQEEATLLKAAKGIGFPVLIKASYGGGGRGMRIVQSASEFKEALAGAKREAFNSFGNDHVILEKYLVHPRHVEVQIFADQQQNYCYLFERDCSIQRRHQKLVEEAPAPKVDAVLRKKLGEAAIQAAKAVHYEGAGTIEFLLTEDQQFYFMEMNTRLQVEHPVTEMITGEDLVAWQIQIAQGAALPRKQSELKMEGAAIEVRLCAEDSQNHFLPGTGCIEAFNTPSFVRVDTGYGSGDKVSIYYDSLLAKIIAWGKNREEARCTLLEALDQTQVMGVKTNRTLLANVLQQPDFIEARLSTDFIDLHKDVLLTVPKAAPLNVFITAGLLYLDQVEKDSLGSLDPWQYLITKIFYLDFEYQQQKKTFCFEKIKEVWQVRCESEIVEYCSLFEYKDHCAKVSLNNEIMSMMVWEAQTPCYSGQFIIHFNHQSYTIRKLSRFNQQVVDITSESQLTAPMPGRIVAENVKVGMKVKAGQTILVMEAMKMEHAIRAPYDSVVKAIHCKVGEIVSEGIQLVELTVESLKASK